MSDEQAQDTSDIANVLRGVMEERDRLSSQATRYRVALEQIRDLDPLKERVRSGPASIGDTALAIANGLGKCQKLATVALDD